MIAAWSDITSVWNKEPELDPTTGLEIAAGPVSTIGGLNAGYVWMAFNCIVSAAYVRTLVCHDKTYLTIYI